MVRRSRLLKVLLIAAVPVLLVVYLVVAWVTTPSTGELHLRQRAALETVADKLGLKITELTQGGKSCAFAPSCEYPYVRASLGADQGVFTCERMTELYTVRLSGSAEALEPIPVATPLDRCAIDFNFGCCGFWIHPDRDGGPGMRVSVSAHREPVSNT